MFRSLAGHGLVAGHPLLDPATGFFVNRDGLTGAAFRRIFLDSPKK